MTENRSVSIQKTYRNSYPSSFDLYAPGYEDPGNLAAGLSWAGRVTQLSAFLGGGSPSMVALILEDEEGTEYPLISGVRLNRGNSPLNLLPLIGASDGLWIGPNIVLKATIEQPQNIDANGYISITGFAEEVGKPLVMPPGEAVGQSAIAFQALMTQNLDVTGDGTWHTIAPNTMAADNGDFFSGPGDTQASIFEGGWYIVGLEVELSFAVWGGDEYIELGIMKNISEVVSIARKEPYMLDPAGTKFSLCHPIPLESGCVIDARVAVRRSQGAEVTFAKFTAVKVGNL